MLVEWLDRSEGNSKVLIFFAGWSCEKRQFDSFFRFSGFDVVMISDYTTIEELDLSIFDCYSSVVVVAWSFGVFVASMVNLPEKWLKIAINGSFMPVDDRFGIPEKGFKLTLDSIERGGMAKFNARISAGVEKYFVATTRDLSELHSELKSLYDMSKSVEITESKWDYVFISTKDMIFPPQNLSDFWNKKSTFVPILIDAPHYPFTDECVEKLREIVEVDR